MSESGTTVVYGINSVQAALKNPARIEALWLDEGRRDKRVRDLAEQAERAGVAVNWVGRKELDRKVEAEARHQGAVARVSGGAPRDERFLESLLTGAAHPLLLLVLDGVQDPHNLGACLRSAEAAGVDAVVAPRDRACGLTPVARKVASGAAERLPFVQVTNLARTLRLLADSGLRVVGTDLAEGARPLYDCDLTGHLALVMGAEGKGIRRLTREACDELAYIPMVGEVQSLNVSVATGVCLFEAVRQRRR